MRAYLAIIKDSFREALASRVLWILLALITVLLLLLAPLTYRELRTTTFQNNDTQQWPEMAKLLQSGNGEAASPAVEHIRDRFTDAERSAIEQIKPLPDKPTLRDLREHNQRLEALPKALNRLLDDKELYDKNAWSGITFSREGRDLVRRRDNLDASEQQRFGRLLIEAAFPGLIEASPSTSLRFRYAILGDFGDTYPVSQQQLGAVIRALLPFIVDKFLLSIGLLIAVLVTAPILPQVFDPGSLHLLLSKPIRRSALFLTKFFGGCAFVFLCASYLFAGLYLFFGARFSLWDARLFWCVPIYVFVFAVYYSVAALAGIIWRSAVVSILVGILFWAACFGLGWAEWALKGMASRPRIEKLVAAGDSLIVIDRSHTPRTWNPTAREWDPIFISKDFEEAKFIRWLLSTAFEMPPIKGPVFDRRTGRIVAITRGMDQSEMLSSATGEDGWKYREGPAPPASVITLLSEPDGAPLVVTNYGLHRVTEQLGQDDTPVKILGWTVPRPSRSPLKEAGPNPQSWGGPNAFAIDPQSGAFFAYSKGNVQRFELGADGKYALTKDRQLEMQDKVVRIAAVGPTLLVAARDGGVRTLDSQTLADKQTFEIEPKALPETAVASPAGDSIVLLLQNGRLWLLDAKTGSGSYPAVAGQGDISAVAFRQDGSLLVADRTKRVSEYDPATLSVKQRYAGRRDLVDVGYHYVVLPLYTVLPKPSEFYKTVQHVLADEKDDERLRRSRDPEDANDKPWQPVWSGLAFIVVMLGAGCVYMQRQEF